MNKNIIELIGENGKKIYFNLEAELVYDGYDYEIFNPIDFNMGIDSDEALVFRIENGEYYIEENDDIINEREIMYNNQE